MKTAEAIRLPPFFCFERNCACGRGNSYSVTSEYVNSVVTDVSEETVYALSSSSNPSVMVLPSLPMSPQFTGMAETSQPSVLKSLLADFGFHHERADSAHIAERYAVRLHDE